MTAVRAGLENGAMSETHGGEPVSGKKPGSGTARHPSPWLLPAIAVLLIAAGYARTPRLGLVFDDDLIIKANPFITSAKYIPSYFTQHIWSNLMLARKNYYRPVFLLWLLANYKEFGRDPLGWHISSLLLHLGSVVLLYFLALRFTRERYAALGACLLFGLHPLQVENVAWASACTELLGSLLTLGSVLCYLRSLEESTRRMGWLLGSLFLYALAVLTKETAIIVPAIVFVHEWVGRPATGEGARAPQRSQGAALAAAVRESWLFGVVAAGYLAARVAVLGGMGHDVVQLSKQVWAQTVPRVLEVYLLHLVWPARLGPFYDYPYVTFFSVGSVLLPAGVVLATAVLLLLAIRKSPGGQVAAVWVALSILPVLAIGVFPRGEILHDRYMYQPLIGIALLAGLGIAALERRWKTEEAQWTLRVACAVVAVVMGILTYRQTRYWTDNFTLYRRGVEVAPRNALANNNLGSELMNHGDWGAAMAHFQKAVEYAPRYYLAYYDMGLGYYQAGQFDKAEACLKRSIEILPEYADAHLILGMVYYRTHRPALAIQSLRKAIELNPTETGTHFVLGVVLKSSGDLAGARTAFEEELKVDPNHEPSIEQLRQLDASATPGASAHP